jgi:hypothetical protein
MRLDLIKNLSLILTLLCSLSSAPAQIPEPLNPGDPKGLLLGPGVRRTVDTNGNVIYIDMSFTTVQFQHAAVKLMLPEANSVAEELQLPEDLPITESNLTGGFVCPFGYYYVHHNIGNITTKRYAYVFTQDNRFNEIDVANYDQTCIRLEKHQLPVTQVDFDTPYELATQWLAAASMDVGGLNRDCKVTVVLSAYWNGLSRIGQIPRKKFVPIYDVSWLSHQNQAEHFGDVAFVELYLPTKELIQLCVGDPKYILRKPLEFTNLASLFPGTARISVFTNWPAYTGHPSVPTR